LFSTPGKKLALQIVTYTIAIRVSLETLKFKERRYRPELGRITGADTLSPYDTLAVLSLGKRSSFSAHAVTDNCESSYTNGSVYTYSVDCPIASVNVYFIVAPGVTVAMDTTTGDGSGVFATGEGDIVGISALIWIGRDTCPTPRPHVTVDTRRSVRLVKLNAAT